MLDSISFKTCPTPSPLNTQLSSLEDDVTRLDTTTPSGQPILKSIQSHFLIQSLITNLLEEVILYQQHWWFSGRILASHTGDPGSFPSQCIMVFGASLVAQTIKRLPAMRETQVRFLGREDPLEKEMAIHSSTLAWKISWTEEPDKLQSMGSQRVGHD